VVLSGFAGRYLYVRVPRSIRGNELTFSELTQRAVELAGELAVAGLPPEILGRVADVERRALTAGGPIESTRGLLLGDFRLRRELRGLRAEIRRSGLDPGRLEELVSLIGERTTLLRRIAYLGRTKRLFARWHVFHQPLVYLMLAIAALHVAVAFYMGYALVRW
jgi:hypothetical protein